MRLRAFESAAEDSDVPPDLPAETASEEPQVEHVSEADAADAPIEEDESSRDDQPVSPGGEAQEDKAGETKPAEATQTAIFADSNAY